MTRQLRWPLASLALLALALALWELASRRLGLPALVLPPPSAARAALWKGLASGYFRPHLVATSWNLALGLALGCGVGFLAGVALAESAALRRLLWPWVVGGVVVAGGGAAAALLMSGGSSAPAAPAPAPAANTTEFKFTW